MNFFKGFIFAISFPLLASAQSYQSIDSWRYMPSDSDFWEKVQAQKQKKNLNNVFKIAEEKIKKSKSDIEIAEAQLAEAQTCLDLDYYYCSYDLSIRILKKNPGSMPSLGALFVLEDLIQKEVVIEDELERVLNIGNFTEVPTALMPMLSYYVFKDNIKKNLKEWTKRASKNISEGSYWHSRLTFYKILLLVQKGKMSQADSELEKLESEVKKYPKFREDIQLQRARILYQLREFKESEKIYSSFNSDRRDLGKILLERAWVKYLQKDYSLSLGLIETLKAPYFRQTTHPEQYLLAMSEYRDLCDYQSVSELFKEFETLFKPWVDHLRDQKPLFENKALMSMVLQKANNMRLGNMIGYIRRENEKYKNENFAPSFKQKLDAIYSEGEKLWKDYAKRMLDHDLKEASIEFLDYVEQIKLLDYISGLDKFRMKGRFENREYRAPEADIYAIRKLFWPVEGEYWWEEINAYRVLVSDRCNEGGK